MKHLTRWFSPIVIFLTTGAALPSDFAIRDGDTVVFLGDSITAARTYGKLIENYTLLRYPHRKVRFINAGWGGDTAAGGLARLEHDVLARGATLVTVAYGINDIGWGMKADPEHRQKYLDSIRGIVKACKTKGVRVYICSAAITGGDSGEDNYLQKMCDEGMAISRSLGEGSIDIQRTMRTILNRVKKWNADHKDAHETLHAADTIHLNDLGQLAMGFAILKGLGAPANVSSATLTMKGPTVLDENDCAISELTRQAGFEVKSDQLSPPVLKFTRLDQGLPLNLEPLWQLHFRFIPFSEELNRYMLAVRDLPPGRYEIRVNDRLLGAWDAKQLAAGVNLASATPDPWLPGGPWDAQAHLVKKLTDARNETSLARFWGPSFLKGNPSASTADQDLLDIDTAIVKAQRDIARPVPYRFVIQPAPAVSSKPAS